LTRFPFDSSSTEISDWNTHAEVTDVVCRSKQRHPVRLGLIRAIIGRASHCGQNGFCQIVIAAGLVGEFAFRVEFLEQRLLVEVWKDLISPAEA
jgi:hypothetical protein